MTQEDRSNRILESGRLAETNASPYRLAVEEIVLHLNERLLGNFSRAIVIPLLYLIKTSPT